MTSRTKELSQKALLLNFFRKSASLMIDQLEGDFLNFQKPGTSTLDCTSMRLGGGEGSLGGGGVGSRGGGGGVGSLGGGATGVVAACCPALAGAVVRSTCLPFRFASLAAPVERSCEI